MFLRRSVFLSSAYELAVSSAVGFAVSFRLAVLLVAWILSNATTGFVDLALRNRIQIASILEILSKGRQHLLRNSPSLQVVEPLRFESKLDTSLVDQPRLDLGLVGDRCVPVRQGSGDRRVSIYRHAVSRPLPDSIDDRYRL